MEQNEYLKLSEDGKKVKVSNNGYKRNEEIHNCENENRNDDITGDSCFSSNETPPTLFTESIFLRVFQMKPQIFLALPFLCFHLDLHQSKIILIFACIYNKKD